MECRYCTNDAIYNILDPSITNLCFRHYMSGYWTFLNDYSDESKQNFYTIRDVYDNMHTSVHALGILSPEQQQYFVEQYKDLIHKNLKSLQKTYLDLGIRYSTS